MWRAFVSQSISASNSLMCCITSDQTNPFSSCQHKPPLFDGKNNGLVIAMRGCTSGDGSTHGSPSSSPDAGLPCALIGEGAQGLRIGNGHPAAAGDPTSTPYASTTLIRVWFV